MYIFTDDDANSYPYNEYTTTADFTGAITPSDYTAAHVLVLRHLAFRRRCKFTITTASEMSFTFSGRFVRMLGLDPANTYTMSLTSPLTVELPYDGLTYICVNTNLTRDHIVCKSNNNAQSSSLMCVVPAPGIPGDPIYFDNVTFSGRMGVTQPRIDYIDLSFTDEYGIPLYSLENYMITFAIDWILPTPFPAQDRFSLDQVRVNKKIRIK